MRRPATLALLAALVLAPTLAGCSVVESTVKGSIEQGIRDATGGDFDVNLDEGLPDGYPAEAVPVVEGTINGGRGTVDGKETFVVTVQATDAATAAKDALVAAGFTIDGEIANGDGSIVDAVDDRLRREARRLAGQHPLHGDSQVALRQAQ
ncbi:MAG TPA: hypothetical protein VNJ54_20795 [Plantibacter sp.]|uniref:hypothetical protein n=1 Tax=unclassified Plantibacter TaxID=2624265 RepID=UPI002B82D7EC|nr:hypothetical protein [Plantibacter sp.]